MQTGATILFMLLTLIPICIRWADALDVSAKEAEWVSAPLPEARVIGGGK